jgi:hypothetical protein
MISELQANRPPPYIPNNFIKIIGWNARFINKPKAPFINNLIEREEPDYLIA